MYEFSEPKRGAPDKYQESSLNGKLLKGQWSTKEIRDRYECGSRVHKTTIQYRSAD